VIRVVQLRPEDDESLIAFLDALGQTSVSVLAYHYPFYRDMLQAIGVGEPMYLAALREDKGIAGLLPVFMRRSNLGTVFCSLPFFGPNAGVICEAGDAAREIETALLTDLVKRAETERALSCSVYTPLFARDYRTYDSALSNAVIVEKFTQYVDVASVSWDQSIQYDLRKAEREGLDVSTQVTADRTREFYAIYAQNCRDHDIPLKPFRCVEMLASPEVLGRHSALYYAFRGGEMIGGLLVLWGPTIASYYIPCSLPEARSLQPNTVLIAAALRDAEKRGVCVWNWESSPTRDSGVYRFKKKWGSLESNYRVYVKTFRSMDEVCRLGREAISREFPFFYVWPFDRLAEGVQA